MSRLLTSRSALAFVGCAVLVAGLVPALTSPAYAAGPVIQTLTNPINSANQSAVTATGTAAPGPVAFTLDDNNAATPAAVAAPAVADATGHWSATLNATALDDGTNLTATVRSTDGTTTAPVRKDTVAPAAPVVAVTPSPVNAAHQNAVTVAATTSDTLGAFDTVTLKIGDGTTTLPAVSISGASAPYTHVFNVSSLLDGTLTATATVRDGAGNATTATSTAKKDTLLPVVTGLTATGTSPGAQSSTVSGSTEPGSTVRISATDGTHTVSSGDVPTAPAPAPLSGDPAEGSFTTSLNLTGFDNGTITFSAIATDGVGNVGPTATTTAGRDTVGPVISTLAASETNSTTTSSTVIGDTEGGASVSISATDGSATSTATITAGSDGHFSRTISFAGLADGSITVTAAATDTGNNTGPATSTHATKDTSAPTADVDEILEAVNAGNADAFDIVGPAGEAGAHVTVTVTDSAAAPPLRKTVTGTGTAGSNGRYTVTLDLSGLADGILSVVAKSADTAGNTGATSSPRTATKDTVAPSLSGSQAGPNPATSTATISGEVSEPGNVVITLSNGGTSTAPVRVTTGAAHGMPTSQTYPFTATIDLLPLADGTVTASATGTDTAGNDSAPVTATFVKDTSGPGVTGLSATRTNAATRSSTVTGTTQPGSVVQLSATTPGSPAPMSGSATANGSGAFSTTLNLDTLLDGPVTVTATATDPAGNRGSSAEASTTKDATPPGPPTIGDFPPVNVANANGVTITGTAERGATVTVTISEPAGMGPLAPAPHTASGSGPADSGTGAFSIVVDVHQLADGPLDATAVAKDGSDNTGSAGAKSSTKDTSGPSVGGLHATSTTSATPTATITGSAPSGSTIEIKATQGDATPVIQTGTSNGTFSIQLNTSSFDDGLITFTARPTSAAGNAGPVSSTTADHDAHEMQLVSTSPSGTAGPGTKVRATYDEDIVSGSAQMIVRFGDVNGAPVEGTTNVVDANRTVEFTPANQLPSGTYSVFVDVTETRVGGDHRSDSFSFTVDATAPNAPLITGLTNPVNIANQAAVVLSGIADADSTVSATLTGMAKPGQLPVPPAPKTQTQSATADPSGAFTITFNATDFADGTLSAVATETNTNHVTGQTSQPVTTHKDTVAPAVTGLAATGTSTSAPSTTVTGSTEPGSLVAVRATDGTTPVTGSGTAASNGAFSVQLDLSSLSDGQVSVTATPTDAAGNPGASASTTTSKDTVGPSITGLGATPTNASRRSTTVTGSTEGGSSVRITATDTHAATRTVTITAPSSGSFSTPLDVGGLEDGVITIDAVPTDSRGNTGSAATTTLNNDATNPTAPTLIVSGPANASNKTALPVSGVAENGATVTVTISGPVTSSGPVPPPATTTQSVTKTVRAASNGSYATTVDVGQFDDGTLSASAAATDAAGNAGSASPSQSVTKDTSAPSVSGLAATASTSDTPTSTITGTTDPGATVALSATSPGSASPVTGSTTSDSAGAFRGTLNLSSLADGTVTVAARATDLAGNTGSQVTTTTTRTGTSTSPSPSPSPTSSSPSPTTSPTASTGGGGGNTTGTSGDTTGAGTSPSPSPSPSPSKSPSPSTSPSPSKSPSPSTSSKPRQALTLQVLTPNIPAGTKATLTATGAPDQAYSLQCYTRPSAAYTEARSGAFDSSGNPVSFTLTLGRNTRCFIQYVTNSSEGKADSVVVNVRTLLSLGAARSSGRSYVFQGRNLPRIAGQLITLYRVDSHGTEIRTANLRTDATGIYRLTRTFTGKGTFRFRVRTSQTLSNAAGASNTITVTIR